MELIKTDKQQMEAEMKRLDHKPSGKTASARSKTGEPILTVSLADYMKAKKEGKAIR